MAEQKKKLDCPECGDAGIGLDTVCKIWVKDRFEDAFGIDDIMEEVFHMRIKDRDRIAEALMVLFLENNQIEPAKERDYRLALIDEYERRQAPYL